MGTIKSLTVLLNTLCISSIVIFSFSNVILVNCAVTTTLRPSENDAFIVTTTVPSSDGESWEVGNDVNDVAAQTSSAAPNPTVNIDEINNKVKTKQTKDTSKPEIYSFKIQSDIRYRYSRTYVQSRVANRNTEKSQEVNFRVVLPETAFISKFFMEIDGKTYEAYVKAKEEAKNIYKEAQSQGQSAGLVEVNTRNSNIFNVNVNIKAQSKVNFNLTYEELLQRRLGHYEHSINISPEQISNVKDFQIVVNIEESQNLTLIRVPQLRNDVEAQEDAEGNNKDAIIEKSPAGNKANITWHPSQADQIALSKQGITGKFVVHYDIKRELDAGQVLVMNGYFVHFFAPTNLTPLRKHVVFILDISGSMWGRKIEQLKEAMNKILADLTSDDFFNIITFSSDVTLWGPNDKIQQEATSHWSPPGFLDGNSRPHILSDASKKQPFPVTKENIDKAQKFISALVASGGTNIHDSIVTALNLTSIIKGARKVAAQGLQSSETTTTSSTTVTTTVDPNVTRSNDTALSVNVTAADVNPQPVTTTILPDGVESLIIFLTDGEPTVGITNPTQIQTLIQTANKNDSIPIFSLAFGEGADFPFVRKLSLQNNGFARKIYEASDAAIQLKGFYNEIASPLLSNVTFNYTSPEFEVGNLTLTRFATVFGGTEIAVCGTIRPVNDTATPVNETEIEQVSNNKTTTSTEFIIVTSTTTEIPRLEDSVALPKNAVNNDDDENTLVPTSDKAFRSFVQINGYGRHGEVQLLDPEIFSRPIPWGVPVLTPWPARPTPPPTQEDTFLEKMWAYLSIKQLIDQDLAAIDKDNVVSGDDDQLTGSSGEVTTSKLTTPVTESPKNSSSNETSVIGGPTAVVGNLTVVKETPKQKALRLALKYGFVTPLTSLVVVKPNKTSDVTDAVPSDAKPEVLDSMSAPQSMAHYALVRPLHKTAPVKFTATVNRISGANFAILPLSIQSTRPLAYPSATFVAHPPPISFLPSSVHHAPESMEPDYESGSFETQSEAQHTTISSQDLKAISRHPTTRPLTTTIGHTLSANVLKLKDLKWYNETADSEISVNQTTVYKVAVNETAEELSSYIQGNACEIGGKTNGKGSCLHLRDCIQTEFLDDFALFKSSYLCPISTSSSTGELYAGVCCPTSTNNSNQSSQYYEIL